MRRDGALGERERPIKVRYAAYDVIEKNGGRESSRLEA